MGVRVSITRGTSAPILDFTTISWGEIRIWKADAALTLVGTYPATIEGTPTATTITLRYVPPVDSLAPGPYLVAGIISADGGTTSYPTQRAGLTVNS